MTMAMIEPNTVLPNFIGGLTTSPVAFGVMYSILLGAPSIFNLLFSRYLERFPHKKKFLLAGIYLRAASFLGMAVVTYFFASTRPLLTLVAFYALVLLFALSGGFASIAYADLVGKVLPSDKRPGMYASRQFVGGLAALLGGLLVARVFAPGVLPYPYDYALLMAVGFLGLMVAAFGFWSLKEPASEPAPAPAGPKVGMFRDALQILKKDRIFRNFILVENITSFSLMILPFYMLYVSRTFPDAQAWFGAYVLAQILGSLLSNFFWVFLSKRFGSTVVLRVCILTGAAIPLLAILLQPAGAAWYILVFLLVGFITSGRNMGFEPFLLDIAPENRRTAYIGISGSMNLLDVLLPVLGGIFIAQLGFIAAFVTVSVFMVVSFFLLRNRACPDRPTA
jgi:MFS family permease